MNYKWSFDATEQRLTAPSGYSVTVEEIATQLQDKVHGRADLTGQWIGWRIRGGMLIGPKGQRLSLDWVKHQTEKAA